MLRPFPHMNNLQDNAANIGSARTHALELNFQRRFAQGFNLNASYTRMKQENRTFLDNEYETEPTTLVSQRHGSSASLQRDRNL